jgi:hypothetical protein
METRVLSFSSNNSLSPNALEIILRRSRVVAGDLIHSIRNHKAPFLKEKIKITYKILGDFTVKKSACQRQASIEKLNPME